MAVDQIIINFGEAGASALQAKLALINAELKTLQNIAASGPMSKVNLGGSSPLLMTESLRSQISDRSLLDAKRAADAYKVSIGSAHAFQTRLISGFNGIGSAVNSASLTVDRIISRFTYFGFVVAGLSAGLFQAARSLMEFGGKSIATSQLFETTAQKVGSVATDLLPKLESASLGTISKFDLMRMSNAAMVSGLDLTGDQLTKLVEAATKLGLVMGRDTNDAFQRLIFGITKGERRLLDELGIILQSRDAFKQYADEIGETTNEMDRHQKIQAFLSYVLDSTGKKLQDLGGINWELISSVNQINKLFTDFAANLGEVFIKSGAAETIIQSLRDGLGQLLEYFKGESGKKFFTDIANAIRQIIELVKMLIPLVSWLMGRIEKIVKASIGKEIGDMLSKIGAVIGGIMMAIPGLQIPGAVIMGGSQVLPAVGAGAGWFMGRGTAESINPQFDLQNDFNRGVMDNLRGIHYQPAVNV